MIGQKNKISKVAVLVASLGLILTGCGTGRAPASEGPSERGSWPRWTRLCGRRNGRRTRGES